MEMTAERIPQMLLKTRRELPMKVAQNAARIPTGAYVGAGLACCTTCTALAFAGKTRLAIVFGTWASTALLIGLYAKK